MPYFSFHRTTTYPERLKSNTAHVRMGQRRGQDETFNGAVACVQLYATYMTYGEISKVAALCRPECKYTCMDIYTFGMVKKGHRDNIPTMQFMTGIPRITRLISYVPPACVFTVTEV